MDISSAKFGKVAKRMYTHRLLITLLIVAWQFILVQHVQAQDPNETIGGVIGTSINQAINSAQEARANMNSFNRDLSDTRRRYQACGGTCADRDRIGAEFDQLLASKDFFYVITSFIKSSMKKLGGGAQTQLMSMVLGEADGGIPQYAAYTHGLWMKCLENEKQLGAFIELPGPGAYQVCQATYDVHRQRRNTYEYYEIPGKRAALLASGAPAGGAPLHEQLQEPLEPTTLPGGIKGQQVLKCKYGPIGTSQDFVLATFQFWTGKIPLTRAEMKAQWGGFVGLGSWRDRILNIPEMTLVKCPPGEQNAMALYEKHYDPKLFEKDPDAESKRKVEQHQMIARERQRQREEEAEYRRLVQEGQKTLAAQYRLDEAACAQDRECVREASRRYRAASRELKTKTLGSLHLKNFIYFSNGGWSGEAANIAEKNGRLDACQNTRDETPRAEIADLALHNYPKIAAKLMDMYDAAYMMQYSLTVKNIKKYPNFGNCRERQIQKTKESMHWAIEMVKRGTHGY